MHERKFRKDQEQILTLALYYPLVLVGLEWLWLRVLNQRIVLSVFYCALGLFLWTVFEYFFHRFVEHGPKFLGFLETVHEHTVHHREPRNPEFMVVPIAYGSAGLLIMGLILFVISWSLPVTVGLLMGLTLGHWWNELVHYGAHYVQPRNRLIKRILNNHIRHHAGPGKSHFGMITAVWDRVFGTMG